MSSSTLAAGIRLLRGKLALQCRPEDSDEQLLHAFSSRRDESAFAALVRRHGPMVLHVCRRVLDHQQDAEDAFQATFLVLARNAATLRNKASLASFLHGTAYRTAMKAKQSAARRRKYEKLSPSRAPADPADELSWREVRTLLDEEIARLPEIYRSVFVLCCLENVSREETARRLCLKDGTVSSRLAEARKRLSQRLARRGVGLTAVLAATALATPSVSALPAGLIAMTIQASLATVAGEGLTGAVSASVAELVKSATATMIAGRSKIVMLLLGAATLLAGVGAWAMPQALPPQTEMPAPPSCPAQDKKAGVPRQKEGKGVAVRGRVVDPEGKPIKGARLYWPRLPKSEPRSTDDFLDNLEIPQRAKSDAEGRFRFELPRSDINPDWNLSLVAAADGYGVAWANWSAVESGGELTLRLVTDHPIEGRIINTEGRPQAGVRVSIVALGSNPEGKLDLFLDAWKRDWRWGEHRALERMFLPLDTILSRVTTAKDGSFRITGAGSERLVALLLRSAGSGVEELYVINRAGFDATAVNRAVLKRVPAELRSPGHPILLYGPKLTYVRPASRRIEGTVREAGSGKPVAGYRVVICAGSGNGSEGASDDEGRYKLDGVLKEKEYLLNAEPPAKTSWLRSGARFADTQGVHPMTVDVTVARGILISGRVIDKTTGKGVKGRIRFVPLAGNPFAEKPGYDSFKYDRNSDAVDAEGRFQLAVIPGPGALVVQAEGGSYKPAEPDAKERKLLKIIEKEDGGYFYNAENGTEPLSQQNAVKYLDLGPEAGTAQCEMFLQRAQPAR